MTVRSRDLLHDPAFLDQFEEWWKIYPRRCGKGAARRAFASVLRNRKISLTDLMAATQNYRDARLNDPGHPQFTPHPATFLNQERWLDENLPVQQKIDAAAVQNAVIHTLKRL